MQCPNCNAENPEGNIYCQDCGILMKSLLEVERVQDRVEVVDRVERAERPFGPAPACQKCGRQDETLRLVQYPYVISLVVMTMRRNFTGVWCKKHQNQYLFIASLIASITGWIGIPFGVIYTPMALFQLAQGGKQPAEPNAKILTELGKHKEAKGDYEGARKCYEESLKYHNDKSFQARTRIKNLSASTEVTGKVGKVLTSLAGLFAGVMATGAVIGIIDYLISYLMTVYVNGSANIFLVVLTWTPLIALSFLGGLVLFQLIEWAFKRMRLKSTVAAVVIGGLAALIAVYSIPQGAMIADYFAYMMVNGAMLTTAEAIYYFLITMLMGGATYILSILEQPFLVGNIYLTIMAVFALIYLGFGIHRGTAAVKWQKKMAK